ncbi:5-hydroxyisourate hydrolase precursor [Posidoniimonas polymericola]|uniref:5-hydroxyisourate hydrolase n=1 Tax=Posidoniimonas polymericola TaxID=2528002 RepID=A0A5C5YMC2_9BACT|nr:hydroxyisourate hydrolase [Posidoniimonas polymericola]TWT76113.1 5-hydroxyisourate hydrolase precursor [Posidoniimonas polymericola]
MSPITTHVLDTSVGRPAAGVRVELYTTGEDSEPSELAAGVTNADGRLADLLGPGGLEAGTYTLRFDTGAYFAALGIEAFFPRVEITFRFDPTGGHYHVPLLLSPFGYSTYRGS